MRKISTIIATAAVTAAIAFPSVASAAYSPAEFITEGTEPTFCSMPYVDDLNDWGSRAFMATIVCAGNSKAQCKVTLKGKRVRVTKHHPRVWTAKLVKGKYYRISVRVPRGAWKTIGFKAY